jgi:hypothetical protein
MSTWPVGRTTFCNTAFDDGELLRVTPLDPGSLG